MLEARPDAIEGQVPHRIRGFRDSASAATTRPTADLSNEPTYDNLAFAFVEMQAQTLKNITTPTRLPARGRLPHLP
jgi:hypothetical protein